MVVISTPIAYLNATLLKQIWTKHALKDDLYGELFIDAEPDNKHVIIESSLDAQKQKNQANSLRASGRIVVEIQSMADILAI